MKSNLSVDTPSRDHDHPGGDGISPSVHERRELGRQRRSAFPRAELAHLAGAHQRPDPVALLQSQDPTRVADLIPIRYGRMLASPFAFFRGSALIMASDLAAGEQTGIMAQLCGDAHVSNFGLYSSPERSLVFDVNDFDETLPGPWEWDVKRLVTSVAIIASQNGFGHQQCERMVRTCARAYRERMHALAEMDELDAWYVRTVGGDAIKSGIDETFAQEIQQTPAKACARDDLHALSKLTRVVDGRRRLASDPPLLVPIDELAGQARAPGYEQRISALIDDYRQSLDPSRRELAGRFHYVAGARKVVGVGSVGTRVWVVLLVGRDDDDVLLMQVKQAQPSVLERYLGASPYSNSAERVVAGQRLMQASSDILLGWLRCEGPDGLEGDYYVRQMRDWKQSVAVESMTPRLLAAYARACAHVLARAHARTGDRIVIAGYLGRGDDADIALTSFAEAYARRNERDFDALRAAVADGRIVVRKDL